MEERSVRRGAGPSDVEERSARRGGGPSVREGEVRPMSFCKMSTGEGFREGMRSPRRLVPPSPRSSAAVSRVLTIETRETETRTRAGPVALAAPSAARAPAPAAKSPPRPVLSVFREGGGREQSRAIFLNTAASKQGGRLRTPSRSSTPPPPLRPRLFRPRLASRRSKPPRAPFTPWTWAGRQRRPQAPPGRCACGWPPSRKPPKSSKTPRTSGGSAFLRLGFFAA